MTNFYTNIEQIEQNALIAMRLFEAQENINSIAVFPDIHFCSERAIPVGVAFKTKDVFYPLITGKDMGCGVAMLRIQKHDYIKPFDKAKHYRAFERESNTYTDEGLGGGNHFLSIEESKNYLYIIVHTGSRNLGIQQYQENYALVREHGDRENEFLPIEFATKEYIKNYNHILKYASVRRSQFLTGSFLFLVKNGYVQPSAETFESDSCHNLLEFTNDGVIHRKGSTQLIGTEDVVIPLSMSRGSLIVKANEYDLDTSISLRSCSHGAGRKLSRTDTLKHWHSLKKSVKDNYKKQFSELLNRSGEFDSSILQEFDFAYKDSSTILKDQPYLIKVDETKPIVTVKFTGV